MGRKADNLSPMKINHIKTAGLHFVGHVSGLALHVSKSGARSWILRITVAGKRCDMGLGSYPETPFALAKEKAIEKRQQAKEGIDPIAARHASISALKAERASFITFKEAAAQYYLAHAKGWKNPKHAAQWKKTLETYAHPVIGGLHVKDIELTHILKILEPIWTEKTETANRLRGRIEAVLDWAKARKLRTGDNPAQWRGNLSAILPAPRKVAKVKHHAALDWRECGAFIKEIKDHQGNSARILEFIILTACRSGEARGAMWAEIDFRQAIWIIPAQRMKAGKEHRIPLSKDALKILEKQKEEFDDQEFIFPNSKGTPLSDMSITMMIRRMGKDFTVHGFRSSFRDWAGEASSYPREVIEHALAHKLKDKAEAAYARGDLFTKRKSLMQSWSDFLTITNRNETAVTYIRDKA